MNQDDRDVLMGVAKDVKSLLKSTEGQEKRLAILEHWRTALTSGFAALLLFLKFGL